MTPSIRHADAFQVQEALPFSKLIPALLDGAQSSITAPQRTVLQIRDDAKMLLMPACAYKARMGVKLITVYDDNDKKKHDTIQGVYCLFDMENGAPVLTIDAAELTARRTAAMSALAANLLANEDASEIAIAGAGKLLPYFMQAYAAIRPDCTFRLWARNTDRLARRKSDLEQIVQRPMEIHDRFADAVSGAHIISTITSAREPILLGEWLQPGMHIDLVGAHTPQMREADAACFQRARVFVDSREAVLEEAGDLISAIHQRAIKESDIVADIFELAADKTRQWRKQDDVTLFKSVGHAFEDLAAAVLVEQQMREV